MQKIFFGTDGWRALIGSEINDESVAIVAQAFADYINGMDRETGQAGRVVAISFDTRRCSSNFASIFAEVLSGNGITALLSDRITPTPVLTYATKELGCAAGVMITASHNPPVYNGIKFKSSLGGPFSLEMTAAVENNLYAAPIHRSRENVVLTDFMSPYIARVESLIDFKAIRESGISILIDSFGGAGMTLARDILRKNGCKADSIFSEPSEDFYGRLPEPIEQNLGPLVEALSGESVSVHGEGSPYAFGAATDGDADRMGVCLDGGRWLSAQENILLLVDYIKRVRKEKGGIVKTCSVTDRIRRFESPECPAYDVQVGFKYIADIMYEHPIAFGGEESGGFGYGIHIPERDGIFSIMLMAEMLARSPYRRLSDYAAVRMKDLGPIHYRRIDAHYDAPDRLSLLPSLSEKFQALIAEGSCIVGGIQLRQIKTFLSSRGIINGIKFFFEGECRWLLIRASETENIVRIYAEGQSDAEVDGLLDFGVDCIKNKQ